MRLWQAVASLLLFLVLAGPAPAATQADRDACKATDPAKSFAACTRIIRDRSESAKERARAHYNRGVTYDEKGDRERAMADYSAAIRLDPKDFDAYNNRCWDRAITGRELHKALADCNKSLRISPKFHLALDSRGFVYLRLGRLDKAIADFDAALKIEPKYASSLYARGIAKLRNGDTAGGEADIAAAKAIESGIAERYAGYGVK